MKLRKGTYILQSFKHYSIFAINHHTALPTPLEHHQERPQKIWAFLKENGIIPRWVFIWIVLWGSWKGRASFVFPSGIKTLHVYTRREDPKVSSARILGETANVATELVAGSSNYSIFSTERHSLNKWSVSRDMQEIEQTLKSFLTQLHHEHVLIAHGERSIRKTPASQAALSLQAECWCWCYSCSTCWGSRLVQEEKKPHHV